MNVAQYDGRVDFHMYFFFFAVLIYLIVFCVSTYFNFYLSVIRCQNLRFCYWKYHPMTSYRPLPPTGQFPVQRTARANVFQVLGWADGLLSVGLCLLALVCPSFSPSHIRSLNHANHWLGKDVSLLLFSLSVFPEIQISVQAQRDSNHILKPATHNTEFSDFKVICKCMTFKKCVW